MAKKREEVKYLGQVRWRTRMQIERHTQRVSFDINRERVDRHRQIDSKYCMKDGNQKEKKLRGFVCAYHPAAPDSNPKHTIYAIYKLYYWNCIEKINNKRPGLAHFFKKKRRSEFFMQEVRQLRVRKRDFLISCCNFLTMGQQLINRQWRI